MIQTAFNGFCMAIADSVPGVSGGTIALVLGFYERFIDALHRLFGRERSLRKAALGYLLRLGLGWGLGMSICVLLLSSLFERNIYFMSSVFLGLTAASIPLVAVSERAALKGWLKNAPFFALGTALVVGLSLTRDAAGALGNIDYLQLRPLHFAYIFLSGMVAISAMVLPGISGSSVLLIAGVYLPTINAASNLLQLRFAELPGLLALGLGIICGVGVSVHFISRALKKRRGRMVCLILGLMVGSLFAIVQGPATLPVPLPALDLYSFHAGGFVIGLALLLGPELLKKPARAPINAGKGRKHRQSVKKA